MKSHPTDRIQIPHDQYPRFDEYPRFVGDSAENNAIFYPHIFILFVFKISVPVKYLPCILLSFQECEKVFNILDWYIKLDFQLLNSKNSFQNNILYIFCVWFCCQIDMWETIINVTKADKRFFFPLISAYIEFLVGFSRKLFEN